MAQEKTMYEEKRMRARSGMFMLLVSLVLMGLSVAAMVVGIVRLAGGGELGGVLLAGGIVLLIVGFILLGGLHILKPGEALVLTLFGDYVGTLKGEGYFWCNPFCSSVNPAAEAASEAALEKLGKEETPSSGKIVKAAAASGKKLSLKTMTLNNDKQKINDLLGNPIVIGIAVIWHIEDTAKAVFAVENYQEFLSIQSDAALRNIVRLYPYDVAEGGDEKSLRGSSQEIADTLAAEIQKRVACAGLKIEEARITTLAYAPEIAAAMLQRQQASAVVDARKMIVEGAVGMVEMALGELSRKQVVELDDERKAQMVSNLMVVLCAGKDAQPVVNSGSIY